MWFTRISLKNPVLATMLMLAFVVLGVFSYQRLNRGDGGVSRRLARDC